MPERDKAGEKVTDTASLPPHPGPQEEQPVEVAATAALPKATPPARAPAPPRETLTSRWQEKLRPVMTWLLVALAAFFLAATLIQLIFMTNNIVTGVSLEAGELPQAMPSEVQMSADQALAAHRFQSLVMLDLYSLRRRYHQANVLLMSRVWVRYLGFVTGMILSFVGAAFILGKLREAETKASGELAVGKFSFEGTSPGMFMVAMGVILMLTTILTHQEITVVDSPTFTQLEVLGRQLSTDQSSGVTEMPVPKPTLPWPEGLPTRQATPSR